MRSATVAELKKNPKTYPYPHNFNVTISLPSFIEKFSHIVPGEWLNDVSVSVAGRVHSIRSAGSKLIFYDLCGEGVKIQVRATAAQYANEETFVTENTHIRRGDIIGIEGVPGRTKRGELSIIPSCVSSLTVSQPIIDDKFSPKFNIRFQIKLLSPCLHELPRLIFNMNVSHRQRRFRQRYLDLILNDKVKFIFIPKFASDSERLTILRHVKHSLLGQKSFRTCVNSSISMASSKSKRL